MAAIMTMFVTFLLGGVFFISMITSSLVLRFFESKPQITVFFTDRATQEDADSLKKSLDATGKVQSTKYVTREEALVIYREQNKNDPLLLEMVTADILPASLEVSAKDPKYLSELEPMVKSAQGVEEVVFQKDVVDTLLTWTNAIRIGGGSLALLLTVNSLLIVMTVISMKIALKKEEIEILTLVGASPWYIRRPFVIEGGLYGAIGAFTSGIIITGLVLWVRPVILSFLGSIPEVTMVLGSLQSTSFLLAAGGFLLGIVTTGFLLGSIGSLVAVGRYIRF